MKRIFIPFMVLLASQLWIACTNSTESEEANKSPDSTAVQTNEKPTPDKEVAAFAFKAANGGMMEVELGKLAQEKSSNLRVKNFGAMMVKDHSEVNDNLKSLASSYNLSLPDSINESAKKEIEKLSKKKGNDFDHSYMEMMVSDHNKDLEEFRKAADKLSDSSFKTFAQITLPVLSKHLDSAKAISGKNM